MKSLIRSTVFALMFWVVVAQARTTVDSDPILEFASVWNGDYDDTDQVKNDNQKRDTLRSRFIPVKLTALGGPAFYMEESVNGVVYRQWLGVVNEFNNNFIYISTFNFTDSSRPDPGEEVNSDDLDNLKAEDFQSPDPSCKCPFERLAPAVYAGNIPGCRVTENGQHPAYAITITCDSVSAITPPSGKEVVTWEPYVFKRRGDRFPAKNLPPNYVGPCDRKQ